MRCHVHWWVGSSVSEELAASIFSLEEIFDSILVPKIVFIVTFTFKLISYGLITREFLRSTPK
jgi:hypothetical protein